MDGLRQTGDAKSPYQIDTKAYLVQVVSYIIYLAGPQHAAVNYAQYPLMSYTPAVAGSFYKEPPGRNIEIASQEDCMAWFPPLDIALYTVSFEYLLSGIQFDTLGHYSSNPRQPYFKDPKVNEAVLDFQESLARIESSIRKLNKLRPMPYTFQLPSQIPNSISI
jgi:arachidonate 15-lipoxygenase